MLDIHQLEQLVSVAKFKNLTKAAEELHISQPALSRSMQKLERELDVSLFERRTNKIFFTSTGELAVEYAQKVLDQMNDMVEKVQAYDRSQRTISIGICAPAPLWDTIPLLSSLYADMTVSYEMKDQEILLQGLKSGAYQLIITTFPPDIPDIYTKKCGEEQLYFSLPPGHALASAKSLHFRDLDGETMLLFSKIGFWHEIHRKKMPSAHFLLQEEQFAFAELVRASALPSFTSDAAMKVGTPEDHRITIPILDEEAHATYYCSCKMDRKKFFHYFFLNLDRRTDQNSDKQS